MAVTQEQVLAFTEATPDFLCPMSANEYGVEFFYFRVRDMDSGQVLFEVKREAEDEGAEGEEEEVRLIRYHFGPDFLKLRALGSTLQFKVGPRELRNFRMIERHYFRTTLIKSFDFNLEFCIPNTINSWEIIYELPPLDPELEQQLIANPWETKSDSFYFVDGQLIMHNKAEYNYAPFTS